MKGTIFIPQYEPTIGQEELKGLQEVVAANWISEGPKTKLFERMVADFLGVEYVVSVSNGTLAIAVACMALDIGEKSEVIIPDLTMAGTANGVILSGAAPVFVDVMEDLTMDPEEVERKINKKTRALIPVHLNGRASDMTALSRLSRKYNLNIIEDAAQAFGSKLSSKYLGTFGDVGCFSFSVPKVVTTAQGGMLVTRNKYLYQKILKLKDQGRRERGKDIHDTIGFNFRFSDIQASIGIAQMKKLNTNLRRKKAIYSTYLKLLNDISQIKFVETDLGETVPWFVDIYLEKRAGLIKYLAKNRIGTREIYPAMHTHKAYRRFTSKKELFPSAQKYSSMGLWLPSSMKLTNKEINKICLLIKKFFSR